MKIAMKTSAVIMAAFFVSGCGFTGTGDTFRQGAATRGAAAYDEGLVNAEWFMCNAASVGSIKRRYGRSQSAADSYNGMCDGEDGVDLIIKPE